MKAIVTGSAVCLLLASGCRSESPGPALPRITDVVVCHVDVAADSIRCRGPIRGWPDPAGSSIDAGRLSTWALEARGRGYSAADSTYHLQVRLRNRTERLMGSPDGVTTAGTKVFLTHPPAFSGLRSSTPRVDPSLSVDFFAARNPDGNRSFTHRAQPYWHFPEVIEPSRTSTWREWMLVVPPERSEFAFSVGLFTAIADEPVVPAIPPDEWPEGLHHRRNRLVGSPHFGLSKTVAKGMLSVWFQPDATAEDRQIAIGIVNGRVVGGFRGRVVEGGYHIRVPDDGPGAQMRAAMDTLNQLRQVHSALPVYLDVLR
jgi:hypothetical protein